MSGSKDPSLATLQDDMSALKRDVASLIEHLQTGASATAASAAAQIDQGARKIYRNVAAEGEKSAAALTRQVEEQPLIALLIVLGIGFVGGRLLPR